MIRLSLPLSQYFDIFDLEDPRVPQAIDDRIYVVHDDALDRENVVVDNTITSLVIAAGNTLASTSFSFPDDHYLYYISLGCSLNPANVEWVRLTCVPFGDPHLITLALGDPATSQVTGLTGLATFYPDVLGATKGFPYFARRETDYTLQARTNVGGGATVEVSVQHARAPAGVRIVR